MQEATPVSQNPFDRRQKRILAAAWGFTLLPLLAFGYLTWEASKLREKAQSAQVLIAQAEGRLKELADRKAGLESEIARLDKDLQAQRESTKHYRDVANIRIQFYRESDREVVEKALVKLGFKVETRLGQSRLINRKPNSLAYGKLVSQQDLRDIAVALVEAGFPLKRIYPAQAQPDPHLIQIYASDEADRSCGLLTVALVRSGSTCGPMQR